MLQNTTIAPPCLIIAAPLMCIITMLLGVIGLNSLPGYHPSSRHRDVQERRVDNVGNDSYKLRRLEAGVIVVGGVKLIRQSCFVMGIRGSVRHLSIR